MLSKSLAQDHLSYSTGFGQIHNNTFFFANMYTIQNEWRMAAIA